MKIGVLLRCSFGPAALLGLLFTALLLFSCGFQEQADVASSGETGSVFFSVKWVPAAESSNLQALGEQAADPLANVNVCEEYGIQQVALNVLRANGSETGVKKTEPCSAHTATLEGVPADVELYVELTTDPPGWGGESERFTLTPGGTEDLGEIDVERIIPPQWHTAEPLNEGSGELYGYPNVGIDGSGNAIAVWNQEQNAIYVNYFNRSKEWEPKMLLDQTPFVFYGPKIAMNAAGDAIVVFCEYSVSSSYNWLNAIRYTKENGWDEFPQEIHQVPNYPILFGGLYNYLDIAMDAQGNAIVVYLIESTMSGTGIEVRRYTASTDIWSGPGGICQVDYSYLVRDVHIAMDASGNAMVVWRYYDGEKWQLASRWYDVLYDRWDPTALIESDMWSADLTPRLEMDDNRNAIIMYPRLRTDLTMSNLVSRQYADTTNPLIIGGSWSSETIISNSLPDDYKLAVNGEGKAMAVWFEFDEKSFFSKRYTPSDGWEEAKLITASSAYFVPLYPLAYEIAMDASGNVIEAWAQIDYYQGYQNNYAQFYSWSTDTWGPESLIEDISGNAVPPYIAMNDYGNAVAVWRNSNTTSVPFANHYD